VIISGAAPRRLWTRRNDIAQPVPEEKEDTMRFLGPIATAATAALLLASPATAEPGKHFIIHELDHPPKEAAAMVRAHTEAQDDWLFLAEFGLAGGSVTALKICYPAIGPDVVAAGMHTMAMMPCGHLAFYEENGQSTLSMLDMSFMTKLDPHPRLENAATTARAAFAEMLSEVLGVE
jgi:selenocysteine lyase/cysteine desulfurase